MSASPVEHIVVLMMENRSFDHMLGYLKAVNPAINGVTGNEWNPDASVNPPAHVSVSNTAGYLDLDPDPGHSTPDVTEQVYSGPNATVPPIGTNLGFIQNYAGKFTGAIRDPQKIMRLFAAQKLPALWTLAQEFAVCDKWHSSVPGQTWPNRMFVHAATSDGNLDNKLHAYDISTIYHSLEDAYRTWKIYFHDIPQALALTRLRVDLFRDRFRLFSEFLEDAKKGDLPAYSFIEPRYYNFLFKHANDQHPNHDVSLGDVLIADVYEAVRNSPLWEHTLLVIAWDEHGGIYDHVYPPDHGVANPDGKNCADPPFDFQRLGIRVPAVFVSPYIPKGAVDSTQYEHASVPATVKKILGLPDFLTNRDAAAKTFEDITSLGQPRQDTPAMLDRPALAARIAARAARLPFLFTPMQMQEGIAAGEQSNVPLNEYQNSLVELASAIAASGRAGMMSVAAAPKPNTEHEGAQHVRRFSAEYFGLQ